LKWMTERKVNPMEEKSNAEEQEKCRRPLAKKEQANHLVKGGKGKYAISKRLLDFKRKKDWGKKGPLPYPIEGEKEKNTTTLGGGGEEKNGSPEEGKGGKKKKEAESKSYDSLLRKGRGGQFHRDYEGKKGSIFRGPGGKEGLGLRYKIGFTGHKIPERRGRNAGETAEGKKGNSREVKRDAHLQGCVPGEGEGKEIVLFWGKEEVRETWEGTFLFLYEKRLPLSWLIPRGRIR